MENLTVKSLTNKCDISLTIVIVRDVLTLQFYVIYVHYFSGKSSPHLNGIDLKVLDLGGRTK